MDNLAHQVAQVIGEVSPDVVREVIELSIPNTIPRDQFYIIRIEMEYSGHGIERELCKTKERLLLVELHRVLKEDYEPRRVERSQGKVLGVDTFSQ